MNGKIPARNGRGKRYAYVLFFRGLPGLIRKPVLGRGRGLFALFPLIEEYGCNHDHSDQRYAGNRRPQGNVALIARLRGLADLEGALGGAQINRRIRQAGIENDIVACPVSQGPDLGGLQGNHNPFVRPLCNNITVFTKWA